MCEYCENKKPLFESDFSKMLVKYSDSGNAVISCGQGFYHLNVIINYCPMCGQKLNK